MLYDVVTFGETMLRLTPPHLQRIEQGGAFGVHIGGSESNTAVGLARLGMRVSWLSRLTDNPLGRLITGTLTRYSVDTSHVVWTANDRVGLYFLEEGHPPRPPLVVYDRAHSAFSRFSAGDLPTDLFQPDHARLLHLTGINIAVGAGLAAQRAVEMAKQAGWLVSFDINHRSKLGATLKDYEPLMDAADILFVPLKDATTVCGLTGSPEEIIKQLARRYQAACVVMTMGEQGALAWFNGQCYEHGIFPTAPVDRLGRGDAFSAGFLYSYLNDPENITGSLRWGAAMAALKYTIPGDMPVVDKAQVEALVNSHSGENFR